MWMSTSFIAAVCLLLMLFHAGALTSTTDPATHTLDPTTHTPDPATHTQDPATHTPDPSASTAAVNSAAGGLGEACIPGQHGHPETCTDVNHVCDLNDLTGHICKLKHGQPCSGGNSENCVNGASCISNNTCQCSAETPKTTSGLCSGIVEVNRQCTHTNQCGNQRICEQTVCKIKVEGICHNTDHCVVGANCTGHLCTCVPEWRKNDGNRTCVPILPAGHNCTTNNANETNPNHGDWCTDNSDCANDVCTCASEFYVSLKECLPKIKPGDHCSFSHADHTCVDGARCTGGTCQCVTDAHYVLVSDHCTKQKGHNDTSCHKDTSPCVPNATCNDNQTCKCDPGFFPQMSTVNIILCEPRKPGNGSVCSGDECVANAQCVGFTTPHTSGRCTCSAGYYASNVGRCEKKLPWDSVCYDLIKDECLEYGFCDARRCKCRDDAYRKLNNTCAPTLNYDSRCELMNRDSKQCGNGTQCVFRSNDPNPVCGCDIDHFFHDNECVPRILVGNPCAYIDSTFRARGENQCVENAHCDFATYHICVCDGGHYSREGYCPAQVAAGDTCDPWDHNENQCADYNTCVHGRCQ